MHEGEGKDKCEKDSSLLLRVQFISLIIIVKFHYRAILTSSFLSFTPSTLPSASNPNVNKSSGFGHLFRKSEREREKKSEKKFQSCEPLD